MESTSCKKQYLGKSETSLNVRLNSYLKDLKKADAMLACRYVQERNHIFNKHAKFIAKFITIDQLSNTTKYKHAKFIAKFIIIDQLSNTTK